MKTPATLVVAASLLVVASLQAQDSILKNGDFEDSQSFEKSEWLKGWIKFSDQPSPDEWLRTVDSGDGGNAIEIKAGPPDRYLWQDVKLKSDETGKHYVLRCQAKGQGLASISAVPRDATTQIGKTAQKKFPLADTFETHEVPLDIPEEAAFVRIWLTPQDEGSIVVFDKVELVPE